MKNANLKSIALATALLALPVMSFAHDYTYLEGGFVSLDDGHNRDSGFRLGGSISLAPPLALFGDYENAGDYDKFSAGALFHQPLNKDIDLTAGVSLEHAEGGRDSDTGFGLRGGIRWWAIPSKLEVIPELRYLNVFNQSGVSLRATGLFRVAENLDIAGTLQGGDDDRVEAGVRYNFGR